MTAVSITENQYADLPSGMRLHYASAGRKGAPLILFVHGFPEFWYEWQAQLEAFGQEWFAVAPDLRGFNLSGKPQDVASYRTRFVQQDLVELVADLGYSICVMVAHDWGGAVAWSLALSRPELLSQLVIINAPHPYLFARALANDPVQQKASAYMNWLRKPGSEDRLAKDEFALMENLFVGNGQPNAPWFAGTARQRYRESWARSLAGVNYYRASPLYPPLPDDPGAGKVQWKAEDFQVEVPTFVIWGESDTALPKGLLDGLDALVEDLELVRIPEGSHWIVHEQPDRINELIRNWLARRQTQAHKE